MADKDRAHFENPSHMSPGDQAPPDKEGAQAGVGEVPCPDCNGDGRINNRRCPMCEGSGFVTHGIGGA